MNCSNAESPSNNRHNIPLSAEAIAQKIATELGETNDRVRDKILILVRKIGCLKVLEYARQAVEINTTGGMLTKDGTRKRTLGGIFFALLRAHFPEHFQAPTPTPNHVISRAIEPKVTKATAITKKPNVPSPIKRASHRVVRPVRSEGNGSYVGGNKPTTSLNRPKQSPTQATFDKELLETQRKHFVGALKYLKERTAVDSILLIAYRCLFREDRIALHPREIVRSRLKTAQIPYIVDALRELGEIFKPDNITAGDDTLQRLKGIGYEGKIDDLWLSVHGKWKPRSSGGLSTQNSGSSRSGVKSVYIPVTGQTKRPGSHRDNRGHK